MSWTRGDRWLFLPLAGALLAVPFLPSARALDGTAVVPSAAAPPAIYVPATAHAGGANGADWRTDLQIHNAGTEATTAFVDLLVRDAENSAPARRSVPVPAGVSVRLQDVLLGTFGFTGAAALRVTSSSDRLVVTSRTYNLVGAGAAGLPQGASFGQFVRGVPETKAIGFGSEGRLIQLTQRDSSTGLDFRTNVGFVNLTSTLIDLRLDLHRADGTWLGVRQGSETRLRAFEFRQITEAFRTWGTVADGYAVVRTTTPGGRFLAFATVIDNHVSGDPVFVPVSETTPVSQPTPTPVPTPAPTATPTPTTPPSRPNLVLYRPSGWPSCVVAHSSSGCCTSSACCSPSLSTSASAVLQFVVANSGAASHSGAVRFGLSIDGVLVAYANWPNSSDLEPGKGVLLEWEYAGSVSAGTHTLTLTVDPENLVAESNEADNACAAPATWSGTVVLSRPTEPALETELTRAAPVPLEEPAALGRAASGGEIWIPAAAHASGMNGASWRTDLEVHNPGATAATYAIHLLPRDRDNTTPADQRTFSLDPQKAVRYVDVLDSVFHFTGAAALRIVPSAGTVLATSRTYNLVGVNDVGLPVGASFGQFVPGLPESEAISSSEEGRLIQLTQREAASGADFRTNVGIVNTTNATVDVRLDFYRADGSYLGTKDGDATRLPPRGFRQLSEAFSSWGVVADGIVVARPVTAGGRIFAFATVIDNHVSGDPVCVLAERMAATALPGTGVITGPGGTTVTLPPGATTSGAAVTLVAGSGSTLAKSGETLVSTVVKANVSGTGVAIGNGSFKVTLPVSGTVADPEKLLLKVAVSTGPVYPVAGVYDAAKKTFTAELMKVWNGWTMGVVTRPSLAIISTAPLGPEGVSALGWVTPTDWQTCAFRVFDTAASASAAFKSGVPAAMKKACEHLRGAEFRSPRLWVDGRWNPNARALHLVQGTGPNDPRTSFSQTLDGAAFSMASYTDAQMQSLGQIYFNWDEWSTYIQQVGWSYENVAIHELFHAVQAGYDFRDLWGQSGSTWWHSAMGITEGTATLVGQMFQSNLNGLYGGEVTVRSPEPAAFLSQPVLWPSGVEAYARQDFFAYVAKRWSGGSLRDLRWLFQHLSDQTEGQFGKSSEEYWTLYRKAMDSHYQSALGTTLPEVYAEYAVDRAYRHTTPALLRPADSALRTSSLDPSLFISIPTWDADMAGLLEVKEIWPLSTMAVRIPVSDAARAAKKVTMDVAVKGAKLERQALRIFVYPETDGVLEIGTQMELTDLSQAVEVPVAATTTSLTVLLVNGSVPHDVATVTFGKERLERLTFGRTSYKFNCVAPACQGMVCGLVGNEWDWVGPLVWSGNSFSAEDAEGRVEGELSADRKTLLRVQLVVVGIKVIEWVDIPLDATRTTATQTVYAISGPAAASHVVTAYPVFCGLDYSGIDYSREVQLEVLFGP